MIRSTLALFIISSLYMTGFSQNLIISEHSTTTTTFITRDWTIDKSVNIDSWDLFSGDEGTSQFTIMVDLTTQETGWMVEGSFILTNMDDEAVDLMSVSVDVGGTMLNLDVMPSSLDPGDFIMYNYSTNLPDGMERTSTITINDEEFMEVASQSTFGFNPADQETYLGEPGNINVTDSNGETFGPFSDDVMEQYERTYTCDADAGINNNTATIDETGDSDDAVVSVNCYAITVVKTVDVQMTRTWNWSLDKSAYIVPDQEISEVLLHLNQEIPINWNVTADASLTDSDWNVSGMITISNPHPDLDAIINSVSDLVSPDIAVTVDCGGTGPYTVSSRGGTLVCTYTAPLPDGMNRTNTATATLQNFAYSFDDSPIQNGTTDFSGSTEVNFANANINEIDACANVEDNGQFLGQVCADDVPSTFNVPGIIGPYSTPICEFELTNIANLTTVNMQSTTLGFWTINVTAGNPPDCDSGLVPIPTLSQWGMMLLSLITLIFGIAVIKQRRLLLQ